MGGIDALWRELGRQLAALRREAGLTQMALAALTGFSRTTVSVAEVGRATRTADGASARPGARCGTLQTS
jgi:DNA-binding transcriptional regulator YiaG